MTRGPAKLLSSVGVSDNELLSCDDHEEADTRLFAHVAYSAKEQGCRRAVISATDTDIVMLGQFHIMGLGTPTITVLFWGHRDCILFSGELGGVCLHDVTRAYVTGDII
ncbi:hypothetical protein GQR58_013393 [Nymphon striatum]|nr:hypothetical protein GQR58_013393 [Nymphon striatum]